MKLLQIIPFLLPIIKLLHSEEILEICYFFSLTNEFSSENGTYFSPFRFLNTTNSFFIKNSEFSFFRLILLSDNEINSISQVDFTYLDFNKTIQFDLFLLLFYYE